MLTERFAEDVPRLLLTRKQYRPYPPAAERAVWAGLPAEVRAEAVAAGEKYLGAAWPALPATVFMEFRRDGNREHYETPHFLRREMLGRLVVAECVEGKGRFLDDIINGVWAVCEESFWGVPAHSYARAFAETPLPDTAEPIIDLFAGETAGLLAWTQELLRPELDRAAPVVGDRLRREMRRRILDPYLARTDFWWMGLNEDGTPNLKRQVNNWTPWCVSNCLTAALLLEDQTELRTAAVLKSMLCVDRFLAEYRPDGGCDEGTSYWDRAGGALFDCLELLHGATHGAVSVYGEEMIKNIGPYLYRAHIGGDWFVNFADGGARVRISADVVYRYGRRIGDKALMALGAEAARRQGAMQAAKPVPMSMGRRLAAMFQATELAEAAAKAAPPLPRDAWLGDLQFMTARERAGSERGLFVAAKGGHNAESHNHNDVGHFIVFCDGKPVLIDVGVETYTRKTFSAKRYEIWTMQSGYHNLPTIGGGQQAAGREFAARAVGYAMDDAHAELKLDLAGAYPREAGVAKWRRTVRLERGERACVVVREEFELGKGAEVVVSLMTAAEPKVAEAGVIRVGGDPGVGVKVTYPAGELDATWERIAIEDGRLRGVWGESVYRVLLKTRGVVKAGDWTVRVRGE